jgi:azurin
VSVLRNIPAAAAALAALALPCFAHADPCKLEITGNDQMQYDKHELWVSAGCQEVTLTLHHSGKLPKEAMGHDWVLVNAADLTAVANAGMGAGIANDYVAPGDKRVLARTKVIGGGQTTSVTFPTSILKPGGAYKYLCTFPGHYTTMNGTFKFG